MNKLTNILLGPIFISGVISLVIILFLPPVFNKYIINIVDEGAEMKKGELIYLEDLNGDKKSEWITTKMNRLGNAAIKIFTHEKELIDQINFEGKYPTNESLVYFWDCNSNGFKEIYLFAQISDSAVLYVLEPFAENNALNFSKFITNIRTVKGKSDFNITSLNFVDVNRDSIQELVFGIAGGFSIYPRSIMVYDIKNNTLQRSPFTGAIPAISEISDIDNDNLPEFLLKTASTANIPDSLKEEYHDRSSWLMILDKDLNFLYKPLEFPGDFSNLEINCVYSGDLPLILAKFNSISKKSNPSKLLLYNTKLELIRSKTFENNINFYFPNVTKDNNFYLFNSETSSFELMDSMFNTLEYFDPGMKINVVCSIDIDLDGEKEWIWNDKTGLDVCIYRKDFSHPVRFETGKIKTLTNFRVALKYNGNFPPQIMIQEDEHWCLLDYRKNNLYYLRLPIWSGIYLAIFLIVSMIQKFQRIRSEKQLRIKKTLTELQVHKLQKQLDPHFLSNALQSLSILVIQKENHKAQHYLTKFIGLFHSVLQHSDAIDWTLEEELSFTEDYLALQQLRTGQKFEYKIVVGETTNMKLKIPKMLIQNFAENAVKHAFSGMEKSELKIRVQKESRTTALITITDNGIGMEKAKSTRTTGTGKGLAMMKRMSELYCQIKKKRIDIEIKPQGGLQSGTEVTIKIAN